jgi:integrase
MRTCPFCAEEIQDVATNSRTREGYTVNGVAHTFGRAVERAGITSGDVTLHTLRHTALSRMIANGYETTR